MTNKELLAKLLEIDSRVTIQDNPNRPGLSNIMLDGVDVCPIPTDDIRDHDDPRYYYTFPNGFSAAHNSVESAIEKLHITLEKLKNPDLADAFYGRGEYAD